MPLQMINTKKGLSKNLAMVLPAVIPTIRQTKSPGPAVAATPSMSLNDFLLL